MATLLITYRFHTSYSQSIHIQLGWESEMCVHKSQIQRGRVERGGWRGRKLGGAPQNQQITCLTSFLLISYYVS